MSLTIKLANEEDKYLWEKINKNDPLSTFYDKYEWCHFLNKILKNITPLPFFIIYNKNVATLPFCLRKNYLTTYLESLPFSDYGGGSFFRKHKIYAQADLTDVVSKLIKIGKENNCFRITIRRAFYNDLINTVIIKNKIIIEEKNCTFIVKLNEEIENIFQRINKSRRKGIIRSKERGVTVREASNLKDIKKYYEIYVQTMQRINSSPIPFSALLTLWDLFKPKNEMKIFLAEYKQNIIAGIIRFLYKDTIYSWQSAYLKNYNYQRPLDLLMWHTIQWGATNNYKLLDLGGTPNDPFSGHFIFKNSWGGEKKPLYNYHIILQPIRMNMYKVAKNLFRIVK